MNIKYVYKKCKVSQTCSRCQGCLLSSVLFVTFMDRIFNAARSRKRSGLGISFLLFADFILLTDQDLQLPWGSLQLSVKWLGQRSVPPGTM